MIVKESWDELKNEIRKTGYPVVCFGAGAVPVLAEPLLEKEGIWDQIKYFLDNDESKAGSKVGDIKSIQVMTVKSFEETNNDKFILLIMCERYVSVLKQLNQIKKWDNISCYIYIKLNYETIKSIPTETLPVTKKESAIPKIIHYCWFGGSEKSELNKKCINSWKEFCPDYQVIEWNEKNYDVQKTRYMSEAYKKEKWAYVADYARLDILYQMGGIYLDTDVELLEKMDVLLGEKAFIACGQWSAVNSGAGIGCIKGHPLIKEMRDEPRSDIPFVQEDGTLNLKQNGYYESKILRKYGFRQDFTMQYVCDLLVLSPEHMATASVLGERTFETKNTIGIHFCEGSWANKKF